MNRLVYREPYLPYCYYIDSVERLLGNTIILLVPTLTFVEFRLIGRIFLSEILLIACLPFVLYSRGWMLGKPLPKKLITLGLLWLFGQVITDLVRGVPLNDYARGWAKITFFLANFAALYMLLHGNKKRLVLFALGLVFSGFLAYKFKIDSPFSYARSYPWKFGVGPPITLLVVLLSTNGFVSHVRFLPSLMLLLLALLNLYMGSRGVAGICFLAGVYTFSQQCSIADPDVSVKPSLKKIAFVSLLVIAAAIGFLKFYEYAAEHYWLGKKAKDLVRLQSGSFGILLGGRGALYSAARAIADSPVIGHGSWAKNPNYIDVLRDLEKFGYTIGDLGGLYGQKLIPTHSHLLGSWVESGILGAVFWGWLLIVIAKSLHRQFSARDPLNPLVAFIGMRLIWDIMFSPFGAECRLTIAFFVVLLMSASHTWEGYEQYTADDNPSIPSR